MVVSEGFHQLRELERIEFDLEEVVDRCVELLRPKIRKESVELIVDLASDVPSRLMGDPARLQQILINLLSNAAKFTEAGEILLKVYPDSPAQPERIRFSVSDTGIGIPREKLQVIFEDFTQADSSVTRKYGGTGLGLGIAKRLVQRMGGDLIATSEPSQGSSFTFTAVFETSVSKEIRCAAVVEDFVGLRALVIDDNSTNRLIFRKYVMAWGFESTECRNVPEGLAELTRANQHQRPYSVLLLDMRMPDMDGFDAIGSIRTITPDLPIILLTSDDRAGDATRSQQHGLSGYATKPINRTDLLRLLCKALGTKGHASPQTTSQLSDALTPGTAQSRPIRVLVGEDSLDNQILLSAYLKNSPFTLTFAPNGKEAVEKFQAAEYDMILMDVQMPVMDGLSATRQIRTIEKEEGRKVVPILALSANAFEHDKVASLEAGCNAHLSKPVSKRQLLEAMQRYSGEADPVDATPLQVEVPSELKELSEGYLERRRVEIAEIKESLVRFDCERLRTLGHNMKGAATGYGFPDLAAIGASLECNAKKSSADDLAADVRRLSEYLERVQLKVAECEPADS